MSITVAQWAKSFQQTCQQAFQATIQDAFHTKRQIHKASKMRKHTRTHTTSTQKVKMCTSTHPNKQLEHA
jgi:hypothetical protein